MEKLILSLILSLVCTSTLYAQTPHTVFDSPAKGAVSLFPIGDERTFPFMDSELREIRINAFPSVRFHADDYIQFSPAAVLLLTKACGFKGMGSWGRMSTAAAFSSAFMAISVNGIKYTVRRMRPDESTRNSFPSGHTATAFTMATLLHKEYGWRSPWFSIGGYAVATATALMRMVNDRHWLSDTFVGALIGIGSVHLGYYVTEKIFKGRYLNPDYHPEVFFYDRNSKFWEVELNFMTRFVLGNPRLIREGMLPDRGSTVSLQGLFPVLRHWGVIARAGAGSMESVNVYDGLLGGYWTTALNDRFHVNVHVLGGYANLSCGRMNTLDAIAGTDLDFCMAPNFKMKVYAGYEIIVPFNRYHPIQSINLGFSFGIYID